MDRPGRITRTQHTEVGAEAAALAETRMTAGRPAGHEGANSVLEGTWRAVDASLSGSLAPEIFGQRLTFSGDRFQIRQDGELRYGGTFGLDPEASPSTIEFFQSETDTLSGIWLGIYHLMGDALTICDNAPDMFKPRPKGFGDGAKEGYVMVHFHRES